jgi:hypothetical protein
MGEIESRSNSHWQTSISGMSEFLSDTLREVSDISESISEILREMSDISEFKAVQGFRPKAVCWPGGHEMTRFLFRYIRSYCRGTEKPQQKTMTLRVINFRGGIASFGGSSVVIDDILLMCLVGVSINWQLIVWNCDGKGAWTDFFSITAGLTGAF